MKKIIVVLLGFGVVCFLYVSCKEIGVDKNITQEEESAVEVTSYEEVVEENIVEEKPKDTGHNTLKEICSFFNSIGDYRYDLAKFTYYGRDSIYYGSDDYYDIWVNENFEYEGDEVFICIDIETHKNAWIQFQQISYPIMMWKDGNYLSYFESLKGFWKTKNNEYINIKDIDDSGNFILDLYLIENGEYVCYKSLESTFEKTEKDGVSNIIGAAYHAYYNGMYNNELLSLLIGVNQSNNTILVSTGIMNKILFNSILEFNEHLNYTPNVVSVRDIDVYATDIIYELYDGHTASNKEYIRDMNGNILGSLEYYDNGDIYARNPQGTLIGRYLKMSDVTLDGSGKIVYRGNYVQMLIK